MPTAHTIPIIRTRDGAQVNVGDTWDTGPVMDLDGKIVDAGDYVELLDVDIPDKGEGRCGAATVRINGQVVSGPLIVRSTHPGFPGRRVAFIEL